MGTKVGSAVARARGAGRGAVAVVALLGAAVVLVVLPLAVGVVQEGLSFEALPAGYNAMPAWLQIVYRLLAVVIGVPLALAAFFDLFDRNGVIWRVVGWVFAAALALAIGALVVGLVVSLLLVLGNWVLNG